VSDLGTTEADIIATTHRLSYSTGLAAAVAEIEAVPEIPVYAEMAALLRPQTLVATNSSTLLPRDLATRRRSGLCCGR